MIAIMMARCANVRLNIKSLGDFRYINPNSPATLTTEEFTFAAPYTIEVWYLFAGSSNPYRWLELKRTSDSSIQAGVTFGSKFKIAYGLNAGVTCDKDGDVMPTFTTNIWYHVALVLTSTGPSLYFDSIFRNTGYVVAPCVFSASFAGTITLRPYSVNIFRELRAVSYAKTSAEIYRYMHANHFYSDGAENSQTFLFYYPLDDITASYCYRNIIAKTYICLDPTLRSSSAAYWRVYASVPLYVCSYPFVYNYAVNKCELGKVYPGYTTSVTLTGTNNNPSSHGITFWVYISSTATLPLTLAEYRYPGNR